MSSRLSWRPFMHSPSLPYRLRRLRGLPTLLAWGKQDPIVPLSAAEAYQASIPGAPSWLSSTPVATARKSSRPTPSCSGCWPSWATPDAERPDHRALFCRRSRTPRLAAPHRLRHHPPRHRLDAGRRQRIAGPALSSFCMTWTGRLFRPCPLPRGCWRRRRGSRSSPCAAWATTRWMWPRPRRAAFRWRWRRGSPTALPTTSLACSWRWRGRCRRRIGWCGKGVGRFWSVPTLPAKSLGIIGLGRIGKAVARRARGFDMPILAADVVRDEPFAASHGVRYVTLARIARSRRTSCPSTPRCRATPGILSMRKPSLP